MAGANLPAKKYKKTSPTQLRLCFEGTGNTTRYIDIARALSIINRKFYRQGVYYYVNSVELINNANSAIDLYTAPDTWVTKNAWNRAFGVFQKMNAQVDTPRPKYHDFKIKLRSDQTEALTMDPDLYNKSSGGVSQFVSLAPDEWQFSKFTTLKSNGGLADEFTGHLLGPHDGPEGTRDSVGLIMSYAETRAHPPAGGEPTMPSYHETDPLNTLFVASGDLGEQDIMDNLDDHNDETPYDHNDYIGESSSHMQHVARLATVQTTNRVAKASGFCVPFGLMCVDPINLDGSDTYTLILNLAAGTYHGVYAERA